MTCHKQIPPRRKACRREAEFAINDFMDHASPGNGVPTDPGRGLPAVTPPSGRFIAQLFLVPGLIVTFAVLLILGINYLLVESRTAEYYLQKLDSKNADVRWRGANDLAQELKRPESVALRSDARFALDLADRLRAALTELDQAEQAAAPRVRGLSATDQELAWRKLRPQRDHVQFLAAALGDFTMAVGAPLLCEMALKDDSPDPNSNTHQRRKAIWALGNLGENMKGFAKLSPDKQAELRALLQTEAEGSKERALWAQNALYYLDRKAPSGPLAYSGFFRGLLASTAGPLQALPFYFLRPEVPAGVVEVDRVLARCARDPDRYLRAQVALVLNFWDSPLVEPTLLLLAQDDGHGTLVGIAED
jgi:hypothetical protein